MRTTWTEADFETMGWHDNHVHGIQVEGGGEYGTGTLILDLDYIIEWLPVGKGRIQFRVAPATLTFYNVFALKIELDWAGAAMTPFSISSISRDKLSHDSWSWLVQVNWPKGLISFEATGFHQALRASPIVKSQQHLEIDERRSRTAV